MYCAHEQCIRCQVPVWLGAGCGLGCTENDGYGEDEVVVLAGMRASGLWRTDMLRDLSLGFGAARAYAAGV